MPEKIQIPSIQGLDSSKPDYVKKLEEGIEATSQLYKEQIENFRCQFGQNNRDTISALNGIEGVIVEELPEETGTEKIGEREVRKYSKHRINILYSTSEQLRKIDDIFTANRRTLEDSTRGLEDNLRTVERAHEDFAKAIAALTKVIPLNKTNFDYETLHFYMPLQEGVYEAHVDLTNGAVIGPEENPNLRSEEFSESGFVDKFKKQLCREGFVDVEANAYMVTNPSKLIPVKVLVEQGLIEFERLQDEYSARKQEEERRGAKGNPAKLVINSVKKGIKNLLTVRREK